MSEIANIDIQITVYSQHFDGDKEIILHAVLHHDLINLKCIEASVHVSNECVQLECQAFCFALAKITLDFGTKVEHFVHAAA